MHKSDVLGDLLIEGTETTYNFMNLVNSNMHVYSTHVHRNDVGYVRRMSSALHHTLLCVA